MDIISERIRNKTGIDLIVSADEAAKLIEDGMVIGVSGFTPADDPKAVPAALAERVKCGEKIKIDVIAGGALGVMDRDLSSVGALGKRLAFTHNTEVRKRINAGEVSFMDMHLSLLSQYISYKYLPKIDYSIVEVLAIDENGDLIPSIAVGSTDVIVENSEKVIVEIAMKKSLKLEGMHDIYHPQDPPYRKEIPVYMPGDRVGSRTIKCGWDKIKAVVLSEYDDMPHKMTATDDISKKIADNVLNFLLNEQRAGRLPEKLPPIQSGLGNVANAMLKCLKDSELAGLTAYTEVIQDGMLELIDSGKMDFASACCLTLSEAGYEHFYNNIDFYRDKILLRSLEISNNPEVIRRLGVISVNTALETDIYGNVNSTHIMGKRIVNGIGGAGDFSRASRLSIFTTPSTTKEGRISCIVPMCSHIDQTEHDVDVIVTEYGVADLRGLSPKERAVRIINNCVHPEYREKLKDYFSRAVMESACQTPHILKEALSWHVAYEEKGTMK